MPSLNPRIIDALHADALALAEAVRDRFERLRRECAASADDLVRVQVSCEALRTTTRVMHCLAWLLNQRAYFAGELSELQLRRHGRLIANIPPHDPEAMAGLPADVQDLIGQSERLYARIQRLEQAWRGGVQGSPGAIERLRQRLVAAGRIDA